MGSASSFLSLEKRCLMADDRIPSSLPAAGSLMIEYMKELEFLKDYGTISPLTANEEQILDDICAAGFAKKEGAVYVYVSNRNEHQGFPQSGPPKTAERSENGHESSEPYQKESELLDVVAVPRSKPASTAGLETCRDRRLAGLFALGLVFSPVMMAWTVFFNFIVLAGRPASDLATALMIENALFDCDNGVSSLCHR